MGAEQSNTSVVFGEELVLKVYRRLEPGLNPELELLRFLTERGFPNVAPLGGWYAYMGRPLEATQSEKFTIRPPPARRMCGTAARAQRNAARRSTSTTAFHTAASVSSKATAE